MGQKDPSFAMPETVMKGEYLTTYTYTSSNTKSKLYNEKVLINTHTYKGTEKPWGNLVIGDTIFNEAAEYDLKYCIGFNKELSESQIFQLVSLLNESLQ